MDSVYSRRQSLQQRMWYGRGIDPARIDFAYDPFSQLTSVSRFADLGGNQLVGRSQYQYNHVGRVTHFEHLDPVNTILARYDYTYDVLSRLIQTSNHSVRVDYSYDRTHQLEVAHYPNGNLDEFYNYDASGNRLGSGYIVGPNNQILSDSQFNYSYDDEGNLVTRTEIVTGHATQYFYDHGNRLIRIEQRSAGGILLSEIAYVYDVFDRRIASIVDRDGAGPQPPERTNHIYDGNHVWADIDSTGQIISRYLFGDRTDAIVARSRAKEGIAYYLSDQSGTVRDIVDATGAIIDHIDYDSFGNIAAETNTVAGDRYKFTGREFDPDSGFYYFRARFYDPAIGRFISPDPTGFEGSDANLYRYVFNSPGNFLDPNGRAVFSEIGVLLRSIVARAQIIRCLGIAAFTNLAEAGVYILFTDVIGAPIGLSNVYVGKTVDFEVRFYQHALSGVGGRGANILSKIPIRLSEAVVNNPKALRTAEQILINSFGGKAQLLNVRNASRTLFCK